MSAPLRDRAAALLARPALQLLLVALCGALAYANTFQVPFVLDDYPVIAANRTLDSLGGYLGSLRWLEPGGKSRWLPLATLALNKSLGGSLAGFHIANLIFHLAGGCLLYALGRTLLAGGGAAAAARYAPAPLLAALLFVLHPIQTQAVTYVTQRMTVLAALFSLAALLCHARAHRRDAPQGRSRTLAAAGAAISCLLAMCSKENAFTLPAAIALFDLCFLPGTPRQRLLRLAPYVALLLVLPWYLMGIGQGVQAMAHGGGDAASVPLPRLAYLATELRVLVTYLRLLIVPVGQNLDYDYPEFHSLLQPPVALSLGLLLLLLAVGIALARRAPAEPGRALLPRTAGFAILWFFVTLSLESGLVPLLDPIAEHRLYLPSVGFCLAAGLAAAGLLYRAGRRQTVAVLALTVVVLLAGTATFLRNQVWRDRRTLWGDVVAKAPHKVRALTNLAKYHVDALEPNAALPLLQRAVTLNPSYYPARYTLGLALNQRNESAAALEQFLTTTRLAPDYAKGWEEVGRLLLEMGRTQEGVTMLRRALQLDPAAFSPAERARLAAPR